MRKVVVTAIMEGYDRLPQAPVSDWEFICFMDNRTFALHREHNWGNIYVEGSDIYLNGWLIKITNCSNREIKIMTHMHVEYDVCVWTDGNIWILQDPEFMLKLMKDSLMLLLDHPKRKSSRQEIRYCLEIGKGDKEILEKQLEEYEKYDDYSLYQMGLYCKTNTSVVNDLMEDWWEQWEKYPSRDQPSFAFASEKYRRNIRNMFVVRDPRMLKSYIAYGFHIQKHPETYIKETHDVRILYVNTFAPNARIGDYYNSLAKTLPDDTWICATDADTMFLDDRSDNIIRTAIREYPEADLFTGWTNRIGFPYQVYNNELFNEPSMIPHRLIASYLADKPVSCTELFSNSAGFCMIFPVRLIGQIEFPPNIQQNNEFWDYTFTKDLLESGRRIFRINNIYLLHYYRFVEGKYNINHIMDA